MRRRRAPLTASLTAAVAPVTDPSKVFPTAGINSSGGWQQEAWRFTRTVGELGFYVRWRSNACAQVRLVASEIDEETGIPTGSVDPENTEGQQFVELVKQIAGGPLGQKALIKRSAAQLTVPGELHICILQRPEGERWYAVGNGEFKRSEKFVKLPDGTRGQSVTITLPDGTKHDYDPSQDAMFRVWNESFEDATKPDSPVRACLDSLAEIERATKKIRNADQSRLLNNGLLMVPSEASLPDTRDNGDPEAPSPTKNRRVAATLQKLIIQAAQESLRDEKSLAAHVPIVAAAPGEHLGKVVHIEFSKEATKVAVDIRNDAIARLAMGLDMSPERLMGMGGSNHWSSYQIADEDVKMHIAPVMEVLCQAIYQASLTKLVEAAGLDPAKYTLWYDTSQLTKDPDLTDEAKDAYGTGTIKSKSLIEKLGLPEDALYDWSDDDDLAQWARDRVSGDPTLLPMLGQLIPELAEYEFEAAAQPVDPYADPNAATDSQGNPITDPTATQSTAPTEPPATENANPTTPTYTLLEQMYADRALELAAKRRVTTSDRQLHSRLRNVPAYRRNQYLPAVTESEVDKLIAGWDDTLTPQFAAKAGVPIDALRDAVRRRVEAELTANAHTLNGVTL